MIEPNSTARSKFSLRDWASEALPRLHEDSAAIYHRVLKIIVGGNGFVPTLLPRARALYPQWTSHNLHQVHAQVYDLNTRRAVFTIRGRSPLPLPMRPRGSC
jgi:hypothetical protein